MKTLFNLSLSFSLVTLLFLVNDRKRIFVIISMIFFPLCIQFIGKDALTVSTVCIYIFSTLYLIRRFKSEESLNRFPNLIVLILILLAIVSTLSVPFGELTGKSIRQLSNFLSAMMLFVYIINLQFDSEEKKIDFVENILTLFLIMVCIQIGIGIIMYKWPEYAKAFSYFTFSNMEGLHVSIPDLTTPRGIKRLTSLIFQPESFGEILAVLSPIALHKFLFKQSTLWLIVYVFFGVGLILSVTRSGIILFVLASLLVLAFNMKRIRFASAFSLFGIGSICFIMGLVFFSGFFDDSLYRFRIAHETFRQTGNFSATVNRAGISEVASFVFENINLFGHGLMPAYHYKVVRIHFHNLYLTVVWQFGLIGSICYLLFLMYMFLRVIKSFFCCKSSHIKILSFSMIVSMGVFFVNELKYEFNRAEAYQQICWALFAIYMLWTNKTNTKPS